MSAPHAGCVLAPGYLGRRQQRGDASAVRRFTWGTDSVPTGTNEVTSVTYRGKREHCFSSDSCEWGRGILEKWHRDLDLKDGNKLCVKDWAFQGSSPRRQKPWNVQGKQSCCGWVRGSQGGGRAFRTSKAGYRLACTWTRETPLEGLGRGETWCEKVFWLLVYSMSNFKPSGFLINHLIKHLVQNSFLKHSK